MGQQQTRARRHFSLLSIRSYGFRIGALMVITIGGIPDADIVAQPPAEMSFGQRQLTILLADRPEMRDILEAHRDIEAWLAESFQPAARHRIYWDYREPAASKVSDFLPAHFFYPYFVRMSADPQYVPEVKLVFLVSALASLRQSSELLDLVEQAQSGEVTRDEFVDRLVEFDFHTVQETKRCLELNGFLDRVSRTIGPLEWLDNSPNDLGEFREQFERAPPTSSINRQVYEQKYEEARSGQRPFERND